MNAYIKAGTIAFASASTALGAYFKIQADIDSKVDGNNVTVNQRADFQQKQLDKLDSRFDRLEEKQDRVNSHLDRIVRALEKDR